MVENNGGSSYKLSLIPCCLGVGWYYLTPMGSLSPLLAGEVNPNYLWHTCAPSVALHLRSPPSASSLFTICCFLSSISHAHTSVVNQEDGWFRCAAQVKWGHCHRRFNLHQLSPSTSSGLDEAKAKIFKSSVQDSVQHIIYEFIKCIK